MFNLKEFCTILAVILLLSITSSFIGGIGIFLPSLLAVVIIIFINVFSKKITSYYLDSGIEIKLWEIRRFGYRAHEYFKKPIPAGIIFPLLFILISVGYVKWMASLVFDIKAQIHRAAKRHGLYSFSEMTETHIGIIAASGIIMNFVFAGIGYLLNFPLLTQLSIFYIFFNMIPMSDLDGNKIFNGNVVLWSFLAILTLVGLVAAIMVV